MSETEEEKRSWEILEIILDSWNSQKVTDAFEAHYQSGYKSGYEKGQDDYRDALLKGIDAARARVVEGFVPSSQLNAEPKPLIAKSITEIPNAEPDRAASGEPAKAASPEAAAPPKKDVGGCPPTNTRQKDLPANFELACEAIEALGGRASAPQIRDYIRRHRWSGLSDHWTAVLYDLVHAGKLSRDGLNFVTSSKISTNAEARKAADTIVAEVERQNKPVASPKPSPSASDGSKFQNGVYVEKFEFNGSAVMLHPKEYMLAVKLRAAMGKGHLPAQFLISALGYKQIDGEAALRDLAAIMNPKIKSLGVMISFYRGFGFLMTEISDA